VADLIVQTSHRNEALVISLIGAGDLPGSQTLDKNMLALLAQRPTRVIFDLSELTFISSIFMGSLIRFRQTIGHVKGKVVICSATESVLDALRRARLDQVFEIYPTIDDAMQAICASVL
jgi:anti-sigma B factor antagonist